MLTGGFLVGYAIARIIGECFREPDAFLGFLAFGTTMGQILSRSLAVHRRLADLAGSRTAGPRMTWSGWTRSWHAPMPRITRPDDPFADFTTAPEISQVFGEILGLWAAVTWQSLGCPGPGAAGGGRVPAAAR